MIAIAQQKERPAIEISDLHKSYGNVQAVKGITMNIAHGEIFGFLGPNGAGKTTTIRCMLDLIRPTAGNAFASWAMMPSANGSRYTARLAISPAMCVFPVI